MLKKKNDFSSPVILVLIAFIVFCLLGYFNYLYPLWQDDGVYSYIWNHPEPIKNISDIFVSQYYHYMDWGGRVVVHFIAQLLLLIGKPTASFINALAFVALIYMMYKISNLGQKTNWMLFLLLFLGTWLFQPILPNTLFWITGSANYLWGTLIILLFVYSYISYFGEDTKREKMQGGILKTILFLFFGVIAGWTNENMGVALVPFILLIMIYLKYKISAKIPSWMYSGVIGVTIGAVFMIMAPGNFIRLDFITEPPSIWDRIVEASERVDKVLTVLTVALIVVGCKIQSCRKEVVILSGLFFVYGFMAIVAMLGSPEFPHRAWFGIITMMLIACGMILANLNFGNLWYQRILIIVSFAALILFGVDYIKRIPYMRSIDSFWDNRDQIVKEAKERGEKDVVFYESYNLSWDKYDTSDMSSDPKHWKNMMYKKYYGLNSVCISDSAQMVDMKRYYKKKK